MSPVLAGRLGRTNALGSRSAISTLRLRANEGLRFRSFCRGIMPRKNDRSQWSNLRRPACVWLCCSIAHLRRQAPPSLKRLLQVLRPPTSV
jgi:hypothetical protein